MKACQKNAASDNLTFTATVSEVRTAILSRRSVEQITGISRSLIYELMTAGKFPRQVRLSPNRVGWISYEVDAWVQQKIQQRS